MDDPLDFREGKLDVTRVMEALRERIRRQRERMPVAQLVTLRLQELADEAQLDPDLLGPLLSGERGWNLNPDYRVVTHRRGLDGWLVVTAKRLIAPIVRLYTDTVVNKQAQVNRYLLTVCESLLHEVARLNETVRALKERCEALEAERRAAGSETPPRA